MKCGLFHWRQHMEAFNPDSQGRCICRVCIPIVSVPSVAYFSLSPLSVQECRYGNNEQSCGMPNPLLYSSAPAQGTCNPSQNAHGLLSKLISYADGLLKLLGIR